MIRAIRRFFALRAAHRALVASDRYMSQPTWDVSIATALRVKAERLGRKAARLI